MQHKFIRTLYRTRGKAPQGSLSITKTGRIGLNSHFTSEAKVKTDSRAAIYWDETAKSIAISITTSDDTAAYPIGTTNASPTYINAAKFFQASGIDPSEYEGSYTYDVLSAKDLGISDAGDKLFVLSLG